EHAIEVERLDVQRARGLRGCLGARLPADPRLPGSLERDESRADRIDGREQLAEPSGGELPSRIRGDQPILDRVRVRGDLGEVDDARGAFQRVRGAEQTPNAVGVELTALQTDQPLFEHREEVARLDAEVAEPVLLHAARALGVCTSLASRSERLSISPAVWTVCPAP